jgi:hypothetical protein
MTKPSNHGLTAERARELLDYSPETGALTWKVDRRIKCAGKIAGSIHKPGGRLKCVHVGIDGHHFKAHRIAWLITHGLWPEFRIDHINGDPTDNRLVNLREASPAQNSANSKCHADNMAGLKGVSWHKRQGRWSARIYVCGTRHFLGYFDDPADAHKAYAQAATQLVGSFARF